MNDLLAEAISNARSKQVRSIVDWATHEVVVPDGKFRGQRLRLDTQPVARLWLEAIDSGRWTECVYTGPSQSGKTLIGYVVPLLYHTCELAESCVMGVPFGDMAANKWRMDVRPVLAASPNLRECIPAYGEGSAGGKAKDMISLNSGGVIKIISAGGDDANKAGFTARVVVITEAARFSHGSDTSEESDPLRQLRARQRAYPDTERRTYIEGTTTIESELPWRLRAQSTRSKIVTPCPHCRGWISPERSDLLGWDQETESQARACARWYCPACGQEISDDQRRDSLQRAVLLHGEQTIDGEGNVAGDAPDTSRLWFRTSAWHNCFLDAGDLGVDEWRAAQIQENSPERSSADKELCQFVWCTPYAPPKFEADLDIDRDVVGRERMRPGWPKGLVPRETEDVALAIDLGEKEGWYLLLSLFGDGRKHVIDYGAFDVLSHTKPVEDAIKEALDEMRTRWESGWICDSVESATRSPDEIWIDAGNWGETVKQWASGKGRTIVAAYGRGETQLERSRFELPKKTGSHVIEVDKRGRYYCSFIPASRCYAVFWDADLGKYESQQSLTLPLSAPGATTLFAGTRREHERFARHICNEKLITEHHAIRGEKQYWKRTGANHLGDCLAMACVAVTRAQARRIRAIGTEWD